MGHQAHLDSFTGSSSILRSYDAEAEAELDWPFGKVDGVDWDDLRETAYEIFFTACRSSPGFGGRNALNYYPESTDGGGGGGTTTTTRVNGGGLMGMSRIKRSLGLKTIKRMAPRKTVSSVGSMSPSSPRGNSTNISLSAPPQMRTKRPMTSAEIMRQQMRVSEQSDNRLRKTLMRTLVGQMGRRAETIILPLEFLRHLKPSEFDNPHEYQLWQKRQFKILEAGLLLYPSIPLGRSNSFAMRLRDITRASEVKTIDTSKSSETMRTICNCVLSLAWRSANGSPNDDCHWADGFPLNIHLYLSLLNSIFDHKDETLVLDEIDELLELMKKTWSTLGINKLIHNVCFTWVLFQQYVVTEQVEQDLLCASLAMLVEVANDAKKADRDIVYVKILSSVLTSMQGWAEKKMLDYHENFPKNTLGLMENVLPLALSAARILEDDLANLAVVAPERANLGVEPIGNRVDYYIRSSLRNAFAKILENGNVNSMATEMEEEASEALCQLAQETEDLATKEKETFSPILKRWHPIAAGAAAVSLHNCYGTVLKQYMAGVSMLTNEAILVLQRAGKLEKVLVQMVVEDSVDCEDGGKAIVREMHPYEVDSIILSLLKTWVDGRLKKGKDCLHKAKETETWNPKSKTEPYAQSAVELMRLVKETVDDFFEIPIGSFDDLVQVHLSDGLELLFQGYTSFVASCGSKQSYIPALPPLTRCNRGSKFQLFWRKVTPCKVGVEDYPRGGSNDGHHHPRPSTSRGTQRLYIRLNTLHYILSHLNSLDKTLSLTTRANPVPHKRLSGSRHHFTASSSTYLDLARSSIQAATQHVSEVAAYRLIFLDSNSVFYDGLYECDVVNARISPALRILKQNLTLLAAILTDRAQPLAIKEVMRASFEVYLMVLLAGGCSRVFSMSDHEMIVDDFESLKRMFCSYGEGLVAENVVEKESETVEGVVALMGQSTEQLVEDFSIVASEASGLGMVGAGQKLPMPPTTGRWNRANPNTILRILCHRNDSTANKFLKKTFQLAKRR